MITKGIYDGTLAEILYAVLLGLCYYITETIDLMYTQTSINQISHVVTGIYKDSGRQSDRSLPDMFPFRKGLKSITKLKANECFAIIFILLLAMSDS